MTSTMTFQTSPGLGISMSWVYCVLPFSGALMLLYLIKDSIKIVKSHRQPGADRRPDHGS